MPGATIRVMEFQPTALYRLYDDEGALLYIGLSRDPKRRWKEHRKEMPWWPEVVDKQIEWLPPEVTNWEAEQYAIRMENPRYNKVGFGLDGAGYQLGPVLPAGVPPQPWGARTAYQCRELRPMFRQEWFLWRLLLQDALEAEKECVEPAS